MEVEHREIKELVDFLEYCVEQHRHITYIDYKNSPQKRTQDDCPICFNSYQDDDKIKVLKCPGNHSFHVQCIDNWLFHVNRCPMCNQNLR